MAAYTTIDDPSAYFQTTLYTGNATADTAITNSGNSDLQPDWIWIKRRDSSADHNSFDSSRGTGKHLAQNQTQAEQTVNGVTAFNSDGFTLSTNGDSNANTGTFAAWQWKANGGTTATNSNGNRDTTVQADTTSGFSILTYLSNGSAANQTLGHGLGVAPDVIISKRRGATTDWLVYHKSVGVGSFLLLNETNAVSTTDPPYKDDPTSTVFSTQNQFQATDNFVSYCFVSKQGFSKFGSYTGNGNADGAFIYLGFAPAWLLIKRTNGASNWNLYDNRRESSGGGFSDRQDASRRLFPNNDEAESANTVADEMEFVSNGFKLRGTQGSQNSSSGNYVYMAFAENPFVTSTSTNSIPTTAR